MTSSEQPALAAAHHLAEAGARSVHAPVRSVILHGSLTLADFVPNHSDIDLLMVVDRPATWRETDALVAIVRSADLGGAGGIDLHVVTADVAAAPPPMPWLNLHVGRYPGKPFAIDGLHCSTTAAGRWALARDRSLTAIGQALAQRTVDPATPVDEDGIRDVLVRALREVGEQSPDSRSR
jgi:hypothetical protein